METTVLIVGAGPSGLATSACLAHKNIPNIVLEREDCHASLWKKRTYDRLKLHIAKEFCSLPFMPHSPSTPTFMSKHEFIRYIDDYVSTFDIKPRFYCSVESAVYDEGESKWRIEARNVVSGNIEVYVAKFLVVASGENDKGYIPDILGLESFRGEIVHSREYKSGLKYEGKRVLVVGCGNSGMEIAYDLSDHGAWTSIVVTSPFHVVTKEILHIAMWLRQYLPISAVDFLTVLMENLVHGNLSKYGIQRPKKGPFHMKLLEGKAPIIDVGTIEKIKNKEIKVLPEITTINKNVILFKDGMEDTFDAIIFATGYVSKANDWLKNHEYVLDDHGMPKNKPPHGWKGEKGAYCAGLSRDGLKGISKDAKAIVEDIVKVINA